MKVKSKTFIISALILFMCNSLFAISIEKLKENPARYDGDIVRLRGEVTFKVSVPFTDLLVYILKDKTSSILVFSAFPKERDERVSIKAEVVAYIGEENELKREEIIKRMSLYLVEKKILEIEKARKISEISMRIINSLTSAVTGTWFVIEQEKSGFFIL